VLKILNVVEKESVFGKFGSNSIIPSIQNIYATLIMAPGWEGGRQTNSQDYK
jgi:hypothetical protein